MIPKRTMQGAMDMISQRMHCSLAGFDLDGHPIARAGSDAGCPSAETMRRFARSRRQREEIDGATVIKITSLSEPVMIMAVYDAQETVVDAVRMGMDLLYYQQRDRFDSEGFLQSLLSGALAPSEVRASAGELGLDTPCRRLVYAVAFEKQQAVALIDHLSRRLKEKLQDRVMTIRHSMVLVIHEAREREADEERALRSLEHHMAEAIREMTEQPARIGCGCYAEDIGALRRSYEEAVAAIETGRLFNPHDKVHRYEELLIEHLVRHLPRTFCQWFLRHTFSEDFFEDLDREMARTATVYLDNNMNAAEAGKQLYFHRNAVHYRLGSIRRRSGLDLRKFRDASLFRLGWAIHRYAGDNEVRDNGEVK